MIRWVLSVVLTCTVAVNTLMSQDIYYRNVTGQTLKLFADSGSKIVFKDDASKQYAQHFNYVLKFFDKMEFHSVQVVLKPSKKTMRIKPSFASLFQAPQNRDYKIYFSSSGVSALDSITLQNLSVNEQVGLIATGVSHIENLSTSGFFEMLFWHFKQLSKNAKTKLERDVELKVLEVGLGYQLLALEKIREEKLKIENWNNAGAYSSYFKHYKGRFLSAETIGNFLNDLPVYATNHFQ
ncbi:MAG: hypothetical protein H0W61_17590 [Bacteroidetes bacterium]|nr:hypothetical protein [Bacteroidota bacterium]